MDPNAAILTISAAAELAEMHPQTLRQYDRLGLVSPQRTPGRGRRYSLYDVAQLQEIQRLSQDEGINLAGIKRILRLEARVEALHREVEMLRAQLEPGSRIFQAGPEGEVESTTPKRRGLPDSMRGARRESSQRSAPQGSPQRGDGTARGVSRALVIWRARR